MVALTAVTVMMLAAADGATGMASITAAIGIAGVVAAAMAALRRTGISVLEVLGTVALMVEVGDCSPSG